MYFGFKYPFKVASSLFCLPCRTGYRLHETPCVMLLSQSQRILSYRYEGRKKKFKRCNSSGSNQTSWQVPVLYSIVSFAMSSSCSGHQRGWCLSVGKWVCHELLWWWPSLVRVSFQQPWRGPLYHWRYHGLLEFIMVWDEWRVRCHVSKLLWSCPYWWQDVLCMGGEPSFDGLIEAHQQASLARQKLA